MDDAGLTELEYILKNSQILNLTLRYDTECRAPRLMDNKTSFIPSNNKGINEGIKLDNTGGIVLAVIADVPSITTSGIQEISQGMDTFLPGDGHARVRVV